MWWYVLQVAIIGSLMIWNIGNPHPFAVLFWAVAIAAFVTSLIDEPLGFFRWIRAKFSRPEATEPPQSSVAGPASASKREPLGPPKRAVRPEVTGSGGLR